MVHKISKVHGVTCPYSYSWVHEKFDIHIHEFMAMLVGIHIHRFMYFSEMKFMGS